MEWLELESENEPDFWAWLFDDENLYSHSLLTEEHKELYQEFLNSICE